jgi:hypothetical protein
MVASEQLLAMSCIAEAPEHDHLQRAQIGDTAGLGVDPREGPIAD